jgi:hypothetical protein
MPLSNREQRDREQRRAGTHEYRAPAPAPLPGPALPGPAPAPARSLGGGGGGGRGGGGNNNRNNNNNNRNRPNNRLTADDPRPKLPNRLQRNRNEPGGKKAINQFRRRQERKANGLIDPATEEIIAEPENPFDELMQTGPESVAFNDEANARQGAYGLVRNAMGPSLAASPFAGAQDAFIQGNIDNIYTQFEGQRLATPGNDQYQWNDYLNEVYGATPGAPTTSIRYGPGGGLLANLRNLWARGTATSRGYYDQGMTGPGRTITG